MRGYFGIGVEGLSKPMNAGNLMRSAHAFGAQFFFVADPGPRIQDMHSDTAHSPESMPFYLWERVETMILPKGCSLVGVELTDDAVDLPSFYHPKMAAYIMGPEKGSLSKAAMERCDKIVKIPTRFCINVAMAGALVMYDRMMMYGRFAERPITARRPVEPKAPHKHGGRYMRQRLKDPNS